MKRAQMIGLTSGINSVSNAWRSSSPGLSCCLCPGESPSRSRAGVVGSTDTKISPSPRRTPPRCTHKAIPPMSSTQLKPENPGSTQISTHLAVPAAAPTGRRRHWRARRRAAARRSTAAARRLRSSSPPAKHGGERRLVEWGSGGREGPSAGGGDNGRRRSRS